MKKILIYGNTPSKKNSKIISCRGNRPMLFPSKNYSKWHKEALVQLRGKEEIKENKIRITFFGKDNRRFDLTNKAESIMDTLVDAGLLQDDSYEYVSELLLIYGGLDKDNPRVEIEYGI